MKYPNKKIEIVSVILDAIGDDADNPWKDTPVEKLVFEWFTTGRQGDTLRLSNEGAKAFEYANIESFDFVLDTEQLSSTVAWFNCSLALNKKLKAPFYLGTKVKGPEKEAFLRIYDDKVAIIITLHGSVNDFMHT